VPAEAVLAGAEVVGEDCELDCAASEAATANANPASVNALELLKPALMT
jgi:hypothetical protein